MKKLTIICNVSNLEDFSKKEEFVLGQTLHETEVLFACNWDIGKRLADIREEKKEEYTIINQYGHNLKEVVNKIDGSYCMFIDEYDYVSIDYCRMLLEKAICDNSDIVCADIAYYNADISSYVYSNLSPLRSIVCDLDNKSINEMYKKYSKDTSDFGLPYGKLIETGLFYKAFMEAGNDSLEKVYELVIKNAKQFSNVHSAYYYKHEMTNTEKKSFFNSITTPICAGFSEYEALKRKISSDACEVVSFDVFDTLILRNVYNPTDLFRFLDRDFETVFGLKSCLRFYNLRIGAENLCRQKIFLKHPNFEDITLDEIYITLSEEYKLDNNILETIKKKEIELEYKFCRDRACGKDLYNLARYCGKRIICTSDMYLPQYVIKGILSNTGYKDINEIYVSSETRLGKYTGSIYKKLPTILGVNRKNIIHIGDNPEVDYNQAISNGIDAFIIPKVYDLFWGCTKDRIKGSSATSIFGLMGTENDYYYAQNENLGIRCMLAIIINKFFDYPYTGFNLNSDFDADPYFVGYFALGMHLWSFVDWIIKESTNYKRVHFLSRDGYYMKIVYDVMNRDNKFPPSVYTQMSRNLVTLCDIERFEDLWSLREKLFVYNASPQKFVELLQQGLDKDAVICIKKELIKEKIVFDKDVENEECFVKTISIIGKYVNWDRICTFREKLKKYFNEIFHEGDCIVDVGYNGRIEAAISRLCGISLDSFYMHVDKDVIYERQQKYGFRNKCFYNHHPAVSYLVREQFLSKMDPPIKGIVFSDDARIIYGKIDSNIYTEYITNIIQKASVEFAQDMMEEYGDFMDYIKFRYMDVSHPFDHLCNKGKETDVDMFRCAEFEDDFGMGQRFELSNWWKNNIRRFKMFPVDNNVFDQRNAEEYEIFIKYYLEAEKILPKGTIRRAFVRRIIKTILRA